MSKKIEQKKYFILLLAIAIIFGLNLTSFAQDSGYFEAKEGRPPSVYSLCCCKKEQEYARRVDFSCEHIEGEKCPETSQHYKVNGLDCPNTLTFTR